MRFKYINIVYFLVVCFFSSCIKPFDYQNVEYEKSVVVDGLITNEKKEHLVKLGYSSPINLSDNIPLTGASVWIDVSDGSTISFFEVEPGNYKTAADVACIPGYSYTLNFNLPNGETYKSTVEKFNAPIPIDSIYIRYAELPTETSGFNEPGIQFFIDSHDESYNSKYFRYEWEATYLIKTPLTSYYDFDFGTNTFFPRTTYVSTCYASDYNSSLIIGNSLDNEFGRIAELPIHFASGESYKLKHRYSLFVKQFSISQEAFSFYKKIKESNESGGFLFDKQLGSITGNIRNPKAPSESVLGFFEVASVSETRRFFNHTDFNKFIAPPPFKFYCNFQEIIETTDDSISYYMNNYNSLRIVSTSSYGTPAQLWSRECTDCSWYASTIKPAFWID
ncbi:MAG: DUF4249 domain-containing protein [Cyclobacteriaceae bacterium]|nr:DUF4249 domain-containing protein [Cyclobacteriaceae bacterium]